MILTSIYTIRSRDHRVVALLAHNLPWSLALIVAGMLTSCLVWAPFTNRFLSTMTIELLMISGGFVVYAHWVHRRAASCSPSAGTGDA